MRRSRIARAPTPARSASPTEIARLPDSPPRRSASLADRGPLDSQCFGAWPTTARRSTRRRATMFGASPPPRRRAWSRTPPAYPYDLPALLVAQLGIVRSGGDGDRNGRIRTVQNRQFHELRD